MKNIKIAGLFPIIAICLMFLASCDKAEDYTVNFNNAGNLTINVLDGNNQPCNDVIVKVFSDGDLIYIDSTNTTGVFNVGKLLFGEYVYSISAKKENRLYADSRTFQVVAGDNKVITCNPYAYTSKLKFTVVDYWTGIPVEGVSVGLISNYISSSQMLSFEDFIKLCYFIKETNSSGQVLFDEVPVGSITYRTYTVFVFRDDQTWQYYTNNFYASPNETREYTIQISF